MDTNARKTTVSGGFPRTLTQEKLSAQVIIGVNERGQKQFLAIEDGARESTQSWREVLLKLKSRGMNPPQLAIGDGAMGFWAALEQVYPKTRQQRCCLLGDVNIACQIIDAQDDECAQLPAQIIPAKSQAIASLYLAGRDPGRCAKGF